MTVVPWVDIECNVPGLVWEVHLVDIGLGVSSLVVGWIIVDVGSVVPCIVFPLVVEVSIDRGVSPVVETVEPFGTVVDSGVCIGVGLS